MCTKELHLWQKFSVLGHRPKWAKYIDSIGRCLRSVETFIWIVDAAWFRMFEKMPAVFGFHHWLTNWWHSRKRSTNLQCSVHIADVERPKELFIVRKIMAKHDSVQYLALSLLLVFSTKIFSPRSLCGFNPAKIQMAVMQKNGDLHHIDWLETNVWYGEARC